MISDGDDSRLQDDYALAIGALNDQLRSLRATNLLDLEQALQFFDAAKASEQQLKAFLRDDPHNPAIRKLADGLCAILPRLRVLLCSDGAASLDIETIRSLCLGLSTCVAPAAGAMFDKERLEKLRPHLQAMTDVLMERACEAGLPAAIASNGVVLDILNWVSRALKATCIEASPAITAAFGEALTVFEEWLAGTPSSCRLTTHQLGKCAVQINTILKFRLMTLDASTVGKAGRHRLAACGARLCSAGLAARLPGGDVDGVACTNVCNLVKDMMEHGLLSAKDEQLLPSLAGLAQLISRIPAIQMLAGDCRTLANCANFLRVLDEQAAGVSGQALPPMLAPHWEAASRALLDMVNENAFMTRLPSGQTVANLISFVKRCDRRLQQSLAAGLNTAITTPATTTTTTTSTPSTQEWLTTTTTVPAATCAVPGFTLGLLRVAAHRLIRHLLACGPDAFTAPETLSGLLSGLAYIVQRNLAPAPPEMVSFMEGLMANMARCPEGKWSDKSRLVALPALRGLLRAGLVTLEQAQPGLAALLGPSGNLSGYSIADLTRLIQRMGAIEEEVIALPPAEPVPPVPTPRPRRALKPTVPPGYTRIITPSTASSGHNGTDKKPASSLQAAPSVHTRLTAANEPESDQWRLVGRFAENRQTKVSIASEGLTMPQAQESALPVLSAAMPRQQKAETKSASTPQAKPAQKQNRQRSRARTTSFTPEQEWFALLKSGHAGSLERLKQLASQPGLLNRKEGRGRQHRGALAYALASGQPEVVKWLLDPKTGYRFDEQIGPFLSAVLDDIGLLDEKIVASLDYFLGKQDAAGKAALKHHFAAHPPAIVGLQSLLKRHELISDGVERKAGNHLQPHHGASTPPAQGLKGPEASPVRALDAGLATVAPVMKSTTTAIVNTSVRTTTGTLPGYAVSESPGMPSTTVNANASSAAGQAMEGYREHAAQGLATAQLKMGDCYANGTGVAQDKAQAFEWYSKAAAQGLAEAESILGIWYDQGIGVEKNQSEAVKWYSKAAAHGHYVAQHNLANCYWDGRGVKKDQAEAIKWYGRAAIQGHTRSQNKMGCFYLNGIGLPVDQRQAVHYFLKAAHQGLAEAQFNLGTCYQLGIDVEKNQAEAIRWYRAAADQGHAQAQTILKGSETT